jgi:transposase
MTGKSARNTNMKQKSRKKRPKSGEPQRITRAVTHIRLLEANSGKLAALDALAPVYLSLCQQYVAVFCTDEQPNKLRDPLYHTPLSERWHRVAIMQAAGIAQSWRSNRTIAYQQYQDDLLRYQKQQADGTSRAKAAAYHKAALTDPKTHQVRKLNSSVQLNKRDSMWWLTLSYDEVVTSQTVPGAPVVGIDVGIANFVTTSTGKHYGSFHKNLRARHKRDRAKRRRKAKLRACLKKKGVKKLPSTSSRTGQKLIRHVKQAINHAVNQCFADPEHEGVQFAYEQLSVASMRFKAKAQNAYLRASHLGHIPRQIAWNSQKRGVQAAPVISAYSSQECSVCHYTDRKNRPDQRTFRCQVCGFAAHADYNASVNLSRRVGDRQLRACGDRTAIKAVLMQRHEAWLKQQGKDNTSPVRRRKRGTPSATASAL